MKKGDIVTIKDSSFSFAIVDGFLKHHPGEVQKEQQLIIAVNCNLPADQGYCGDRQRHNDTIVRGQISGKITLVQQRFCHPITPKHKVMIDIHQTHSGCIMFGDIVEISDELYRKIKGL